MTLEKREEELTGKTNQSYWNSNSQSKQSPIWTWEEKEKGKEEGPEPITTTIYIPYTYFQPPQSHYHQPKLICVDCDKKLSSMSACCGNNKEYLMNNKPCLACGKTFFNEEMWITFLGEEEHVKKETPIDAVWRQTVKHFNGCPHNDDKIWQMALTKIEGATPGEIKTIKNNLSESIKLD
ncbi:hypothetical protein G9A89_001171 [Geosiphon pyriformis]|nr:hypothetical protein G9A89_001171 [Geosiphon pyriformis]